MTSNYLTTCYKSYSIISSTKANLKLSTEKSLSPYLVIAKTSSLEFFLIKSTGELENMFEYQIFANILYITSIPSYSAELPDHIFILTMDYQFSIATVNEIQIQIDCYGDILYRELDPADPFIYLQDHVICSNNCIKGYLGFMLYKFTLVVIPWKMNENRVLNVNKVCKIKVNLDLDILSLMELGSTSNIFSPKNEYFVGGLFQHQENNQNLASTYFKIYKLEDSDGEIKEPGADEGWAIKFQETIHKIIFMKGDRFSRGLLAFGLHNVYFYLYETKTKYEKKAISLTIGEYVHVPNHDNFLLLSDKKSGCLFLLVVDLNDLSSPIEIKYLGRTSICSTLQYLEKKLVFIGSIEDNSYIMKILDNGKLEDREMPYINTMQTFHNLGNVTGIDLVKMERYHTKRLILTSPHKKESLNLFQKGITMQFSFVMNIPLVIENVFFMKNKRLVLCGTEKTCIFLHQSNDFELTFIKNENFPILQAFEMQDKIVVVSFNKILIFNENLQISGDVDLPFPAILVSKSSKYLCILLQESLQYSLLIYSMDLILLNKKTIVKPVSSIYNNDNFVFLGYWFEGILDYYQIDNLENEFQLEIGSQPLNEQNILLKKSSVCSLEIWEEKFLLIGLNNGNLLVKEIEIPEDKKQILVRKTKIYLIGDRNIRIFLTKSHGILIICDQLFVLKINSKPENFIVEKIVVSTEMETYLACEMETVMETEGGNTPILMVFSGGVALASMESATKYMISPFGEDSLWEKTQGKDEKKQGLSQKNQLSKELVAVGSEYCITANNCVNYDENVASELTVYSLETQEILDCYSSLEAKEQINNLLYDESQNFLIFTTDSLQNIDECIPEFSNEVIGRIYLFYLAKYDYPHSYAHKILTFISKLELRNPIECIKKMKNNFFVFYCGSMLYIYELIKKDKLLPKFDFLEVYKKDLRLNAFQIDVYDEYLIICDPYKNVNLYHYNTEENKLLFIAKVFLGGNLSYSSFYAKEKIICFDDNGNLVISQRKKKAETDLEKISLQILSGLNFGEKITNAIKVNEIQCQEYQKILNKQNEGKIENYVINEIIWTSDRGSIGILAELPRDLYHLFMDLQESILLEMKGKGYFGFEYEKWRQMKDFLGNRIQANFVDGEIIRQIGHLPLEIVEKILNRMSLINKPKLAEFLFLLDDLDKKLFS